MKKRARGDVHKDKKNMMEININTGSKIWVGLNILQTLFR